MRLQLIGKLILAYCNWGVEKSKMGRFEIVCLSNPHDEAKT